MMHSRTTMTATMLTLTALAVTLATGNAIAQEHHQPPPIVVSGERDENPFHSAERGEQERPRTEREALEHQIHVLELALPALREGDRRDAVEIVERAIGARRVVLAGRRDDEAHQIRERAPRPEQLAEALALAARLWREFNNAEKARAVGQLAEELSRPRDRERERPTERPESRERRDAARDRNPEREAVQFELEVLRTALPALREGERLDAVEMVERAIRAREVTLEGRRDDEAHQIRERAPSREQLAKVLSMASDLWQEFGDARKARATAALAQRFGSAERGRVERPAARDAAGTIERIERLEHAMRDMQSELQEINRILRELAHQHEHAESREER